MTDPKPTTEATREPVQPPAVGALLERVVGRLEPERENARALHCWYCGLRLTAREPWHAVYCREQYVRQHGHEAL